MELNRTTHHISVFAIFGTVKPPNSGHLRVLKNLSVTERRPLLGGNLKKIVTFDSTFCLLFMACPLFGMTAIKRFHCINNLNLCHRNFDVSKNHLTVKLSQQGF